MIEQYRKENTSLFIADIPDEEIKKLAHYQFWCFRRALADVINLLCKDHKMVKFD